MLFRSPGERVFALLGGGGYAELAAAHAAHVMRIPPNLSFEQAACICETYLTAYMNVFLYARLADGETVLLVPELERENAERQSARADIVSYPEFPGVLPPFRALAARVGHRGGGGEIWRHRLSAQAGRCRRYSGRAVGHTRRQAQAAGKSHVGRPCALGAYPAGL